MRTSRAWLGLLLLASACGDDTGVTDAGGEPGRADASIDAGGSAAGADTCRASDVPGCHEACEYFYDCVAQSGIASTIESTIRAFGFDGADCNGCVERCEQGTGNRKALACFKQQAATAACSPGGSDPTVAANALNECCDGQVDSTFCRQNCEATTALASYFPTCKAVHIAAQAPACVGACPGVTSASALPVKGDATWQHDAVVFDPAGNMAIAGGYRDGSIDFGDGPLPAASETPASYLAVFDASGDVRWSTRVGEDATLQLIDGSGSGNKRVAFDADGNVTLVASVTGPVDLGDGPLPSLGESDVLLASWTSKGSLRWAHRFGGPGEDLARRIAADGDEFLVSAQFRDTADFGGDPLEGAGGVDVAIARYDSDGKPLWSRRYGGADDDFAQAVPHPSGEYTLAGEVHDGVDFGDEPIAVAGKDGDSFVARFAADGTLRWVVTHGSAVGDFVYRLTADGEEVLVADYFGNDDTSIAYGPERVTGLSQVVARYHADGTVPWAFVAPYQPSGEGQVFVFDLHADAEHRVAFSAWTGGEVDLGGGPLTATGPQAVASFGPDGAHRWSMQMGSILQPGLASVGSLATGEWIVAGRFEGNLDYGSGVLMLPAPGLYVLRFAAR